MPRDTEGYRIEETWDVLGMRATRSDDTILDGAFVPDRYIVARRARGRGGHRSRSCSAIFAWALLGFGNIYYGLARRALDMTLESVKNKAVARAVRARCPITPEVQHRVGEMGLAIEPIEPHLERIADGLVERRRSRRHLAGEDLRREISRGRSSWRIVDLALEVAGGFGIFRKSGLEQIFRDARLGRIHPANSMLTHELVAKTLLGISPDETPRWGYVQAQANIAGLISSETSEMRSAGRPARRACSRIASRLGASYSQ